MPSFSMVLNQSAMPAQNFLPTRIMGMALIFLVCTMVRTSPSSSSVPKPPGKTITAVEYLRKQTNLQLAEQFAPILAEKGIDAEIGYLDSVNSDSNVILIEFQQSYHFHQNNVL